MHYQYYTVKNLKRKPILLRGHGTELLRKSSVSNCSSSYKSVLTILSRIKHSRTQGLHALLGLSKCNFSSEIHQSRPFFFDKTNGKTSILYIIWRERTTHIFFVFPKKKHLSPKCLRSHGWPPNHPPSHWTYVVSMTPYGSFVWKSLAIERIERQVGDLTRLTRSIVRAR